MRLLLIRHGQTPSNVLGALDTSVPGPGLTELGARQADAVPVVLAAEGISAVYASVQRRAFLTAVPLAAAFGLPVIVREGLREISAGELEMRNDSEAVRRYHDVSFGWADGDPGRRMPGGENGREVLARFEAVLAEIHSAGHATAAVVAHGQVIRVWVAARTDNVAVHFAARTVLHNTGVVVVDGDPDTGWTTRSWAGVALGGASVDEGAATGPAGEPV